MAEQQALFAIGRKFMNGVWVVVDKDKVVTNAQYGQSPHNRTEDDKPCSLALDLFVLSVEGVALWPPMFFAKLNTENELQREPVKCGIKFKELGDANHFEWVGEV